MNLENNILTNIGFNKHAIKYRRIISSNKSPYLLFCKKEDMVIYEKNRFYYFSLDESLFNIYITDFESKLIYYLYNNKLNYLKFEIILNELIKNKCSKKIAKNRNTIY